VAVKLTGIKLIDPIVAILVAIYILWISLKLLGKTLGELLDRNLPAEEESIIRRVLEEHASEFVEFHALRGRKAGKERHIDLHLVLNRFLTTQEAHDLCEHLEKHIEQKLPCADVLIHIEPCGHSEKCPFKEIEELEEKPDMCQHCHNNPMEDSTQAASPITDPES